MVLFAASICNATTRRLSVGAVGVAIGLSSGANRALAAVPGSPPR